MSIRSRSYNFKPMHPVWSTPNGVFNELHEEFGFTLDAAASADNAKCEKYYSESDNALLHEWTGIVWCNPPYGKDLGTWVAYAHKQHVERGSTVVMLLPVRTSGAWFHNYCLNAEIRFIRKRLRFGDAKSSAPFDSMVVIFR